MEKNNKRTAYLDYLRVFATLAVIILHISATYFAKVNVNSLEWQTFNIYDSIVRWAVPVFVMISGALFLNKKEEISTKKLYTKYILRLVIAFIFWSFFYYFFAGTSVVDQLKGLFEPGKVKRLVVAIKSHYHLWFVPMIAGIYMCYPIIKQIVKDKNVSRYFLLLTFIFSFVIPEIVQLANSFGSYQIRSIANALYSDINWMQLNILAGYVFYFILGYELSNIKFTKKKRIIIYVLGLIGFVSTILLTSILSRKLGVASSVFYNNFSFTIAFEALAIFELFKNIQFKHEKINKFFVKLSTWSFGVYLIHARIIELLDLKGFNSLTYSPIFFIPILAISVFIISTIISAILNHIPFVKKYIV